MRISVRPMVDPGREIDVTHRLVAAIAEELWRLYGGNHELNWLEAERHLRSIVADAKRDASRARAVAAGAPGACRGGGRLRLSGGRRGSSHRTEHLPTTGAVRCHREE